MESFFHADFSSVRVHEGPTAPAIGALAFTLGEDLHFAPGLYDPTSRAGVELLGHELAHVVQQRAGRVVNPFGTGVAIVQDPALEAEADQLGQEIASEIWPRPSVAPAAKPRSAADQRRFAPHRYPPTTAFGFADPVMQPSLRNWSFTGQMKSTSRLYGACPAGKAPRVAQRMEGSPDPVEIWRQKLPDAVGIGEDWRLDRVIDEQDYLEYKQYLKCWSMYAKQQMNTDVKVYELQRTEIANGASGTIKTCTPVSWGKPEETACVCDDLLYEARVDLDENTEVQYVIYYQDVAIGVIVLVDGCDYDGIENQPDYFTITGLVKSLSAHGNLSTCIPKFLSVLLKKTDKMGVAVPSARGAVKAYTSYGFVNTGVSANHYEYVCGCTVLDLHI